MVSIWKLIRRSKTPSGSDRHNQKPAKPGDHGHDPDRDKTMEAEPGLDFLDGMSTGTARFIIDREVDPDVLKNYHVKDLENKGRYYLAKIVNQDGEVTDTVLIDKLNRSIHFQKGKR